MEGFISPHLHPRKCRKAYYTVFETFYFMYSNCVWLYVRFMPAVSLFVWPGNTAVK